MIKLTGKKPHVSTFFPGPSLKLNHVGIDPT